MGIFSKIFGGAKEEKGFSRFFSGSGRSCDKFTSEVGPQQAYEYYFSCAPVASAVNRIVDAAVSAWPVISDGDKILSEHPILDLLDKPGYGLSYEEFMKQHITAYLLTGNAYLNVAGPINRQPVALQPIIPYKVTAEEDAKDGYVETYDVDIGEGNQITYTRIEKGGVWRYVDGNLRELIHLKGLTTDIYGESPLRSVKLEIEQRKASAEQNLAFITNGMRPSMLLYVKDPSTGQARLLTDEQMARALDTLKAKYSGQQNAGNVFFSSLPFEAIDLSGSPKDMDYAMLSKEAEEAIAKAYKVPLPLIRGEHQTYSNLTSSQISLWKEAVLPLLSTVFSHMTRTLMPRYGQSNMFLTYNPASIAALQDDNFEQANIMRGTGVFSDNEIRKTAGFEPYSGGDSIYKPATLIPVGKDDIDDDLPLVPKKEGAQDGDADE